MKTKTAILLGSFALLGLLATAVFVSSGEFGFNDISIGKDYRVNVTQNTFGYDSCDCLCKVQGDQFGYNSIRQICKDKQP